MKVAPAERISIGSKKKIALVCSGGATKAGAFHLGVALALQEQGFRFYGGRLPAEGRARPPGPMEISTYVGSSAGSIISSYLAAGYSVDDVFNSFLSREPGEGQRALPRLTYPKMFKLRPEIPQLGSQINLMRRFLSGVMAGDWEAFFQLKWLKITGLFSTAGIEKYLREEVLPSNRFQDYAADLYIVATQLNHSRKVVFGKESYQPPFYDLTCQYDNTVAIADACAASTALPLIFAPYPIHNAEGHKIYYIDGEIRDTLSTHVAVDAGADLVFASYTHQPYHFTRTLGSLTEHGLPAILIQSIYLLIEQKINAHVEHRRAQRAAIEAVSHFCKHEGLADDMRAKIMAILEKELGHRSGADTIYIHPRPTDAKMFFGDHFSLSPAKMAEIVKSGFRATIDTLRRYDFADRKPASPVIGTAGGA